LLLVSPLLSITCSDTPELRLSSMQLEVFDSWKRPTHALPPPAWFVDETDRDHHGPTMDKGAKTDLVQDAATDCSVVASLCAEVARVERGHATVRTSHFSCQHKLICWADSRLSFIPV